MNETSQQELQDGTAILISYDKKKKQWWKEDVKSQLKMGNETQLEDTTNKISVIEISKKI
jgi:hypothetical protein